MPTNSIDLLEQSQELLNDLCDCDICETCQLRQDIDDYLNNK